MNKITQQKLLAATRGSRIGAMLRAALGVERNAIPRFVGKASLTSDDYIICHFVDTHGDNHMGAFAGGYDDFQRNVRGLMDHCSLNKVEREQFAALMNDWVGAARFDHDAKRRAG